MAICNSLTNGLSKSCSTNSGGMNKFYVADFDNVTAVTGTSSTFPTYQWVSSITMAGSTKFYEFQTNKNVCNFTEKALIDLKNGTTFFEQTVSLVLSRRETVKRDAIEKLVAGQKQLAIIVLDSNGIYWLTGIAEGTFVSNIDGGSGTAKADANGYTITFVAMEPAQMIQVDPVIVSAIIA